jgi:Alw26I/Eco31I/Esp3I family type II restriction m6 adenine DNA methyltransferase
MQKPSFERITAGRIGDFLFDFFVKQLGYARIDKDPDAANPNAPEAWRMVVPVENSRPYAIAYQSNLSKVKNPKEVARLYGDRVIPHRNNSPSVAPVLYGFTDGARTVFFSADPARNKDDRFDLSEATWEFTGFREKVEKLRVSEEKSEISKDKVRYGSLEFQKRMGKLRPLVDFLFDTSPLSSPDSNFKSYVREVRRSLMKAVLADEQARSAIVYHLLETPEARDSKDAATGKSGTVYVEKRGQKFVAKKTLDELHLELGTRLGEAVSAAVDTLLLRYVMVRFLEAYHPDAMKGLLPSSEVLQRGKKRRKEGTLGGGKGEHVAATVYDADGARESKFSDEELELAKLLSPTLNPNVSRAKKPQKGKQSSMFDICGFGDEAAGVKTVLEEEVKREEILGGDFYLADLGQAARAIEESLLRKRGSVGSMLLQDFLVRTGDTSDARWEFRYEDLKPKTLQDYYEDSLATALQLTFKRSTKEFDVDFVTSNRQRKELGAYYTNEHLCRIMVERSVRPLFDERLERLRLSISVKELNATRQSFDAVINFSVCDPTMGSAPFLRSTFDYLTESTLYFRLCGYIKDAKEKLPSFYEEVAREYPFLNSHGGKMDADGIGGWEWHVLRRMLYGVDIDLKAVCIACQTFALSSMRYLKQGERFPSFFNINLKLGNALVSPTKPEDRDALAAKYHTEIAELIRMRRRARTLPNTEAAYAELRQLFQEADRVKKPIVQELVEERLENVLGDFTEGLRPFCWELEFPELFFTDEGKVRGAAGFDVIIGNPPWESLEVETNEFFEQLHPGFSTLKPAAVKKTAQQKLLADARVARAFKYRNDIVAALVNLVKPESGFFELQHTVLDGERKRSEYATYKMIMEQSLRLVKNGGRLSLIMPSGFTGDLGAYLLRRRIFETCDMPYVRGFTKSSGIFPGVTQAFCIFHLEPGAASKDITCLTGLESLEDFETRENTAIQYSVELIKRMAPLSWAIPSIALPQKLTILEKLYTHPVLNEKSALNWIAEVSYAELNSSNNFKLFHERGWDIPIWEGKLISAYSRADVPLVGAKNTEFKELRRANVINSTRVVIRSIAGSDDPRRLISTLLPARFAVMDSLNYIEPSGLDERTKVFLTACLNSFVLEWRARDLATNNNVSGFVLRQLPVPRLIIGDKYYDEIVGRAAALLTEDKLLQPSLKHLKVKPASSERERAKLRSEIDAYVAAMYGLEEAELQLILDSFSDVDSAERQSVLNEFTRMKK